MKPGDVVKFMWPDDGVFDLVQRRIGVIMRSKSSKDGILRIYHDDDVWSVPATWCTKIEGSRSDDDKR
jgi:hypothetical protein